MSINLNQYEYRGTSSSHHQGAREPGPVVKRAHNKEYFILEKDGIPVAAIMGADELEDYLELRDPKARRAIQESNADITEEKGEQQQTLTAIDDACCIFGYSPRAIFNVTIAAS